MRPQERTSTTRVSGQSNKPISKPAHALSRHEVIKDLQANDQDGLKDSEAKRRLEEFGPNELEGGNRVSPARILVGQLANAMTLVLIIAMAVSFGIQSYIEGGVIALVIGINLVVGFLQEYGAEKTMDSLRSLSSPTASVVRDGYTSAIPTKYVVPGDTVELKTGDTVPADVRLTEAVNFETDEALLTGEPLPIEKVADSTFDESTGPGDRLNVAFSSTTVTSGRARAIVFATGMHTEVGAIAADLQGKGSRRRRVRRKSDGTAPPHRYLEAWTLTVGDAVGRFLGINVGTPLQKKLARLAVFLFGVAIVCAIIVLAANRFANYPVTPGSDPKSEVAIYAVATGLSMLPACLTVVLTICMANGAKRMVEKNVIVRQMQALETLGSVTDICSDKTGTLTVGVMLLRRAWVPGKGTYFVENSGEPYNPNDGTVTFENTEPRHSQSTEAGEKSQTDSPPDFLQNNDPLLEFLKVASLANVAHVHKSEDSWKAQGDPTSVAIMVFAARFGWNKAERTDWHQLAEYSFDSDLKRMSVLAKDPSSGRIHAFTKGAVERVMKRCKKIAVGGETVEDIDDKVKRQIIDNMEALSASGLRVLALASKTLNESAQTIADLDRETVESDLVFRGLVGIEDPPRPESLESVQTAHNAGIRVRMLTGDHLSTARSIATQIGILPRMDTFSKPVADAMVMTAAQFDGLSESQIDSLPTLPLVLARCTPNTKVRMVEALHRRGAIAAMTGDGVNDAPSLKRADVGIAMGKAGSDVAKSAADIILTDDNFASILNAIEEGRRTASNISKFVLHLLSQNVAQALVLLVGLVFKDSRDMSTFPCSPVQIVWIIMVTSSLPDMGLSFERADPDVLSRPPTSRKGIFKLELIVDMAVYGVLIAALVLGAFSLVVFGLGSGGNGLGDNCNRGYSPECDTVFRARATAFACLTWFSLFLAWCLINPRRSFFRMQPGSDRPLTQWMHDIWGNKFLFWSVVAGFALMFPIIYIPVINHDVFSHSGISWEWAIVFVASVVFFSGVESWKWAKRVYFRRNEPAQSGGGAKDGDGDVERRVFGSFLMSEKSF